jgi:hypothetical protein
MDWREEPVNMGHAVNFIIVALVILAGLFIYTYIPTSTTT